ncbi:MAG: sulfurtransferase [Chloroflexi bacterium]|jgi:rhodanese-related sulfurtransferase|nr:MAG: sulfurtransferase [Chloroflexota bacterium]
MSTHPLYNQLSVQDVASMRERNETFILIDVREPAEYAIARIDGALLHPMSMPLDWASAIDRDSQIVVMCHHGMRSAHVAATLTQRFGFRNVANMSGGIDAWSLLIDPTTPRY